MYKNLYIPLLFERSQSIRAERAERILSTVSGIDLICIWLKITLEIDEKLIKYTFSSSVSIFLILIYFVSKEKKNLNLN